MVWECVCCPDVQHRRVMTLGHVPVLVYRFQHKIWALHEVSDVWCGLLMRYPGHLNSLVTFCHQSGFLVTLATRVHCLNLHSTYCLGTFFHDASFSLSFTPAMLDTDTHSWTFTNHPVRTAEEGGLPMSLSTRATKNTRSSSQTVWLGSSNSPTSVPPQRIRQAVPG